MTQHGDRTEQDWREIAQRVQVEQDPNKMISLVQQLIAKFDEGKRRQRSSAEQE